MKKETYVKMTQPFRDDPKRARALHRANKILTVVIFVAYPCLLLWLLWQKDMRLYKAICVPLDGFIIVTVVRAWINRKRPYEIFELPSVIPKDTKGHSEPACVFRGSDCVYVLVCVPGCGDCIFAYDSCYCMDPGSFRSALYQ